MLEFSLLFLSLLECLSDSVHDVMLLAGTLLALLSHDFVKVSIVHIVTSLLHSLLQLLNTAHALTFLLMFFLHLVVFDSFVELLILRTMLLLFEALHLDLLLENTALYVGHMLVCLIHLCEEVIRS